MSNTGNPVEDYFVSVLARDGVLDPEKIHDEVAAPEHPLHARYLWDDGKAARQYRLGQIRRDIREVEVIFITADDLEARVPRFLSVYRQQNPDYEKGYVETRQVMQDPVSGAICLRQLKRELNSLQKRFSWMSEYRDLVLKAAGEEAAS